VETGEVEELGAEGRAKVWDAILAVPVQVGVCLHRPIGTQHLDRHGKAGAHFISIVIEHKEPSNASKTCRTGAPYSSRHEGPRCTERLCGTLPNLEDGAPINQRPPGPPAGPPSPPDLKIKIHYAARQQSQVSNRSA
jgi:hypothetical protein